MKEKELNRMLISKLSKAEHYINCLQEKNDSLDEKIEGYKQLLELNQKILMWSLFKISEEESREMKVRITKVPMSEVYETIERFYTATDKEEDTDSLMVRFCLKE